MRRTSSERPRPRRRRAHRRGRDDHRDRGAGREPRARRGNAALRVRDRRHGRPHAESRRRHPTTSASTPAASSQSFAGIGWPCGSTSGIAQHVRDAILEIAPTGRVRGPPPPRGPRPTERRGPRRDTSRATVMADHLESDLAAGVGELGPSIGSVARPVPSSRASSTCSSSRRGNAQSSGRARWLGSAWPLRPPSHLEHVDRLEVVLDGRRSVDQHSPNLAEAKA